MLGPDVRRDRVRGRRADHGAPARPGMKRVFAWCFAPTFAMAFMAPPAFGACTPGETRCGADSQVERCTKEFTWSTDAGSICDRGIPNHAKDDHRADDRVASPPAGAQCIPGISRCGADSHVERCTADHDWKTDPQSDCSR